MENFAVFILSHGRADRVFTVKSLLKAGYTGKYYIIIDDEDDQAEDYCQKYGDKVIIFSKKEATAYVDTGDNLPERNVVIYARNSCWRIAKQLNLDYFLVLDDDYTAFDFRVVDGRHLRAKHITDMDRLCKAMIDFLEVSGALTVAMAQAGDFIGGVNNKNYHKGLLRKAMNSFFCKTDRPFQFLGRINEDTTAYAVLGRQGKLMFTVTKAAIVQKKTQSNAKGMTDIYLQYGTFAKSFYSVMWCPSAVKIAKMGDKHPRIHHNVKFNFCAVKILNERYKK